MSYTPVGNEITTTNTTAVTVASAPASGAQRVVAENSINIYNADSASATVVINKDVGGTVYPIERELVPTKRTMVNGQRIVLDSTNETVTVALEANITTTAVVIVPAFGNNA